MKNPMMKAIVCAAVSVTLISSLAAQPSDRTRLLRVDLNSDGAISLNEMLQSRRSRFAVLDSNDDQIISRAELAVVSRTKSLDRRFGALDANKNGNISLNEWENRVAELFARVDANRDNVLTAAELQARRGSRRRG